MLSCQVPWLHICRAVCEKAELLHRASLCCKSNINEPFLGFEMSFKHCFFVQLYPIITSVVLFSTVKFRLRLLSEWYLSISSLSQSTSQTANLLDVFRCRLTPTPAINLARSNKKYMRQAISPLPMACLMHGTRKYSLNLILTLLQL